METELITKDYIDSKIKYIEVYQLLDGTSIENELFKESKFIIVFCKHETNVAKTFIFDTRMASLYGDDAFSIAFTKEKRFDTRKGNVDKWYIIGFLCIK